MLGAFRRYGAIHALRSTSQKLVVRSAPSKLQWLPPSLPVTSHISKSLYHSSPACFSLPAGATAEQNTFEAESAEPKLFTKFDQLAAERLVDPTVIRTIIDKMKIETMTDVQSQTIPETLKGDDVLAQAKTGTGKTLAFLIPVIQNILKDPSIKKKTYDEYHQRGSLLRNYALIPSAADVRSIIISPTRELAEQIAVEARRLTFNTGLVVQCAVGGTQKRFGLLQLRREGCHILIATPGRLKDILSDPRSGVEAPKLSTLVLDEADRLLDDGFAAELHEIQNLLPDPTKVDRQTLMFSATLPKEVMGMVRDTMKPNFKLIKTIREDENPTHLSVPQKAVIMNGLENLYPSLLELIKKCLSDGSYDGRFKAIIYFNTTQEVRFSYELFDALLSDPEKKHSQHPFGNLFMSDIHSGLTQVQRTRISQQFRKCESGILFSSDVTARGLDFPGVTHVIQVGVPRERESYIHRLGRTARANNLGEGWVFLHPTEAHQFKRDIGKDIPLAVDKDSIPLAKADLKEDCDYLSQESSESLAQIRGALEKIPRDLKENLYRNKTGYLLGSFRDKRELIHVMNDHAVYGYGLPYPPQLERRMGRGLGGSGSSRPRQGRDGDRGRDRGRGRWGDGEHQPSSRQRHIIKDRYREVRSRPTGQFNQNTGQFEFDASDSASWHNENFEDYTRKSQRRY